MIGSGINTDSMMLESQGGKTTKMKEVDESGEVQDEGMVIPANVKNETGNGAAPNMSGAMEQMPDKA